MRSPFAPTHVILAKNAFWVLNAYKWSAQVLSKILWYLQKYHSTASFHSQHPQSQDQTQAQTQA